MRNENSQEQNFRIRDSIMSQHIIIYCVKKKLHKYCKIVAKFDKNYQCGTYLKMIIC